MYRIRNLARDSKNGKLGKNGWLSNKYYLNSNIYKLLAPISIISLIQQKLTLVDLRVDQKIKTQYLLMKVLLWSFSDDFAIAQIEPKLQYSPKPEGRDWKQGLPVGILENCVEILIESDNEGKDHLKSFGEFEKKLKDEWNDIKDENPGISFPDSIGNMFGIFLDFHPHSRPILWRILVAQAILYRLLIETNDDNNLSETVIIDKIDNLIVKIENFDWTNPKFDDNYSRQSIEISISVAKAYIKDAIKKVKGFV